MRHASEGTEVNNSGEVIKNSDIYAIASTTKKTNESLTHSHSLSERDNYLLLIYLNYLFAKR